MCGCHFQKISWLFLFIQEYMRGLPGQAKLSLVDSRYARPSKRSQVKLRILKPGKPSKRCKSKQIKQSNEIKLGKQTKQSKAKQANKRSKPRK